MPEMVLPRIGQLVTVLRGKDEGTHAVIVALVDERFVMIADGHKRKAQEPKKKNLLHLALHPQVSEEVADSLRESGSVTNGKLRFAIQKYIQRKGE